jgi:ribosomal protein S18 acetylase RimI-like enzyme
MEIRRLIPGDEDAACRVVEQVKLAAEEVVAPSVDRAYMRSFLADERNYLITAYVDGALAGFILGYDLARVDGARPMMFLYEVGVDQPYRRRGIGRALVEELKRCCNARNCVKMFVSASASNAAAMALYRAAGGVGGPQSDAAAFEWRW